MIISKTKFAALAKVTKPAITKAQKTGALVVRPDGKLDTDNPVNQDYIRRGQDRKNKKSAEKKPKLSIPEQQNPNNQSKNLPDVDFFSNNPELTTLTQSLEALTRTSAEKLKIIEQIRQIQVKTKKERQELVSRELVRKVFAKLYMVDVNQWRTLGANLSPEIAATASIDDNKTILKIGEIIEKEVFVILQHSKRIMNDFLKEIEAKGLE